jgi:hypothetical protein
MLISFRIEVKKALLAIEMIHELDARTVHKTTPESLRDSDDLVPYLLARSVQQEVDFQ